MLIVERWLLGGVGVGRAPTLHGNNIDKWTEAKRGKWSFSSQACRTVELLEGHGGRRRIEETNTAAAHTTADDDADDDMAPISSIALCRVAFVICSSLAILRLQLRCVLPLL